MLFVRWSQGCLAGDGVEVLEGSLYICCRIITVQEEGCHFFAFGVVVVLITTYPFEMEKLAVGGRVLTSDWV